MNRPRARGHRRSSINCLTGIFESLQQDTPPQLCLCSVLLYPRAVPLDAYHPRAGHDDEHNWLGAEHIVQLLLLLLLQHPQSLPPPLMYGSQCCFQQGVGRSGICGKIWSRNLYITYTHIRFAATRLSTSTGSF